MTAQIFHLNADLTSGMDSLSTVHQFDWACKPFSPYRRRPLFGTDFYKGEVTIISAPGGSGKSTWISAMAVSCATGRTLLHDPPHRKMKVLFINGEDGEGEVRLRLEAVLRQHAIPDRELNNQMFVVGSEAAQMFTLTELSTVTRREQLARTGLRALRELAMECRADLILMDPLVVFAPVGQLDNGFMSSLLSALRAVADEVGCAIGLVAHTKKGANIAVHGADANSGAAQITNRSRIVIGVSPVTEEDSKALGIFPGDAWRYRFVHSVKANLAPIGERRVFELVSVGMDNADAEYPVQDYVAVAVPFAISAGPGSWMTPQIQRSVLVAIAQGCSSGQGSIQLSPRPRGNSREYLPPCVTAIAPHLPGSQPHALESAAKSVMTDLVSKGWVEADPIQTLKTSGGKNPAKGLMVRWSLTPWANDLVPGPFVK